MPALSLTASAKKPYPKSLGEAICGISGFSAAAAPREVLQSKAAGICQAPVARLKQRVELPLE